MTAANSHANNLKCPKRFGHRRLKFNGNPYRNLRGADAFLNGDESMNLNRLNKRSKVVGTFKWPNKYMFKWLESCAMYIYQTKINKITLNGFCISNFLILICAPCHHKIINI